MNTLTKIGLFVLCIGIAFGTGRYLTPVKVETKESVRTEVEYITRVIKAPDGTVIKEKISKNTAQKDTQSKTENKKPDYKASIIPQYNLNTNTIKYGASVEKRVLGPIFGGIYADTDKNIGVVISLEL